VGNLNYGVIGNGTSAALVSESGSIDWCCLPAFDSPSVFASLLDANRGGRFAIEPAQPCTATQSYIAKTNILVTVVACDAWAYEITDFMPRYKSSPRDYHCPPDVVRCLRPLRGKPEVRVIYDPRLGYSQHETKTELQRDVIKSYTLGRPYESVYLYTNMDRDRVVSGEPMPLIPGRFLYLSYNQKLDTPNKHSVDLELQRTRVYWMSWTAESGYYGKYHEIIERSSMVLKLLAYQKTGAVVAALTTSLPEEIGAERNWDYRFCWLRDASMTISVFTRMGHHNVGRRYLHFILDMIPYKDEEVQIMYGIDGQKNLFEKTLDWLDGYRDSRPVRVGNAAYMQRQHDIYGLVMSTIYQRLRVSEESTSHKEDLWTVVRTLVRHVGHSWQEADAGIWEIRGKKRHFVFSKVLCWVAIDRAIRIARIFGKSDYVDTWSELATVIRDDVLEKGWNDSVGAFTQSYEDSHLDAANLLLEHYGFIDPDDPRYVSTVERTYNELCRDGLMFRYKNEDDFGEPKSSFTVCSFWMIKSLYRVGRHEDAERMFEQLLACGNHLGLFSEDIDFTTKELLGNFPQGYSHLALIDTAMTLLGLEANGRDESHMEMMYDGYAEDSSS
jgi:GH15 family glucan-1,4-alpha-glucosidase